MISVDSKKSSILFVTSEKVESVSLASRISHSVSKVFLAIVSFFSRYCGSKLNCGYKFEFEQISQEEAAKYLLPVSVAAYSFAGKAEEFVLPLGWKPILPKEFAFQDPNLIPGNYAYFDKKSGLKIAFAERGEEVFIAIPGLLSSAGSEKHELERNRFYGMMRDPAKPINILGGIPSVYCQAEKAIASLLSDPRLQNKRVTLVGQCFGGSIAAYVALKRKIPAICLNTLQLGPGLQADIGDEALKEADAYITHFCVRNDWLTDLKIVEMIDRALTWLGIRTAGNFGKKVQIPTAYPSCFKSHGFVLGSLMSYLGHDKRDTPKMIF